MHHVQSNRSLKLAISNINQFVYRGLFVEEIQTNERFTPFIAAEERQYIPQFLNCGIYASGIGDLAVDACSELLKTPIVVVSSCKDMDVTLHLPEKTLTDEPIFIAHSINGPGHYDGTRAFSIESDNNIADTGKLIQFITI